MLTSSDLTPTTMNGREDGPMAQFGGNEFTGFSVPVVFDGRYFIVEPGDPPLVSVFIERDGEPVCLRGSKNRPNENPVTRVSTNATGIVTVADNSGKFLYKIRSDSETSVAFGKVGGGELSVRISDRSIQAGGLVVDNNSFAGMAGVVVEPTGEVGVAGPIPSLVLQWLQEGRMADYQDRTFLNERISLDGNHFLNCIFRKRD